MFRATHEHHAHAPATIMAGWHGLAVVLVHCGRNRADLNYRGTPALGAPEQRCPESRGEPQALAAHTCFGQRLGREQGSAEQRGLVDAQSPLP